MVDDLLTCLFIAPESYENSAEFSLYWNLEVLRETVSVLYNKYVKQLAQEHGQNMTRHLLTMIPPRT